MLREAALSEMSGHVKQHIRAKDKEKERREMLFAKRQGGSVRTDKCPKHGEAVAAGKYPVSISPVLSCYQTKHYCVQKGFTALSMSQSYHVCKLAL